MNSDITVCVSFRLAADFLKPDYLFLAVGIVGGACTDVEQMFVEVTKFAKREQLLEILQTTGTERTMVFVETKRQADFIACYLCQEKVPTTSIHGWVRGHKCCNPLFFGCRNNQIFLHRDREQRERELALADFRSGKCPVLVATSVAARGLDIPDVQHVVNFDLPNNIDEYVHRIGRTGRCGNTGKAVSFFDPDNDRSLARSLVTILSKVKDFSDLSLFWCDTKMKWLIMHLSDEFACFIRSSCVSSHRPSRRSLRG